MTDALAQALAEARQAEELTALRLGAAAVRQGIACARCFICNEQIVDSEWEIREDELVHVDCKDPES